MGRAGQTLLIVTVWALAASCRQTPSGGNSLNGFRGEDYSELQMTGMNVQSFGENGMDWSLEAPYGEMYTRKDLMRAKNMHVTMFDNGQKSSELTAGEGIMSTGPQSETRKAANVLPPGIHLKSGDMYVNRDVVVVSTDGSKMMTDWAIYSKKTDLITSTAPVTVEREDSITKGVGMEASADLVNVKIFNETLVIPSRPEETN